MSMFKGIGDLIVLLSGAYYPNTVIYKNFYNNTTLPKSNNFVVMNELSSTPLTSLVSSTWTVDELTNENTEVINQLVVCKDCNDVILNLNEERSNEVDYDYAR